MQRHRWSQTNGLDRQNVNTSLDYSGTFWILICYSVRYSGIICTGINIVVPLFFRNKQITFGILQTIVTQNLHLYKVCTANFGFSANVCDVRNQTLSPDERNNSQLIDQIQSYVSSLNIYGSLIEHIPSIFFVLFLGPFSDKYGRKILMIAPVIGKALFTLINMANYYAASLPAEYLLFADVPVGLLGGMISFIMAVNK